MSTYNRANLAGVAAFRRISSRIAGQRPSIPDPASRTRPPRRSIPAKFSLRPPNYNYYSVSQRSFSRSGSGSSGFQSVNSKSNNALFLGRGAKLLWNASRSAGQTVRRSLPWKIVCTVIRMVSSFVVVMAALQSIESLKTGTWEAVPYTNRIHLVPDSGESEKEKGERTKLQLVNRFKGQILPASHPDCVRVRAIARDIIEAFNRDAEGNKKTKKKKKDGFKWEIMVIDKPNVVAFCSEGGKIVVYAGVLKHFKTDAEIATVIGHEVAHAVARHCDETRVKNQWANFVKLILAKVIEPDVAKQGSELLWYPFFSRIMEKEADYIGLLLMASAGYDPLVAPGVYEMLDTIAGCSSTHPSGKERSRLLVRPHVMEEAFIRYRKRKPLLPLDRGSSTLDR